MEQDKLPCTPPDSPDYPCDREVFERVWRRVMPEDRPDCPFVLDEAAAAQPAAEAASLPEGPAATAAAPGVLSVPAMRPAMPMPMPQEESGCAPEHDVPCLGAASAVYGAQLQQYIDHELADWRTYQLLSRRATGTGGKVLSTMAADERRHAKRLSTA